MTALPTLYANGDPVNFSPDWDANTNTYLDIDEGIAGADGVEVGDDSNTGSDNFDYYTLTNMPTDFSSMDNISINIRYRVTGAQTNNRSLYAQIYTDEATPVALTTERTIATNITNTTAANSGALAFTISGTPTKTQWDNAVIRLRLNVVKNKGGDTNGIRVDTFELTGNYTASITPTVVNTSAASAAFSAQANTAVPGARTITTTQAQAAFSAQATTAVPGAISTQTTQAQASFSAGVTTATNILTVNTAAASGVFSAQITTAVKGALALQTLQATASFSASPTTIDLGILAVQTTQAQAVFSAAAPTADTGTPTSTFTPRFVFID